MVEDNKHIEENKHIEICTQPKKLQNSNCIKNHLIENRVIYQHNTR